MDPDADSLDQLAWALPLRVPCTFEAAGWTCRSTGFLWFSDNRDGGERLYPCPRCNADLFLLTSRRRATAQSAAQTCICCGPNLARLAYQSALDEARAQADIRRGLRSCAP